MTGTRPRPSAPPPEALIVAHGQPGDPAPAEAEIAALARRVGAELPGWRVRGATLAAPGALEAALGACAAPPLVYPLFMTDGWFVTSQLPARLGNRAGRVLAPLGLDPALPALAAGALTQAARARGWASRESRVIIAGHGSGRSRNSARATEGFARALAALTDFADIRTGYVEEPPFLRDAAAGMGAQALCLPFFAARRGHVIDDIPAALEAAAFAGDILDPIGLHPGVPALIARALRAAAPPRPSSETAPPRP
ncbi:CbiX/SirB N-terminal domain-containing protein [Actibacterium sp. MT2.3-13A]|uniref:sirohydrochlorin chelatase n=1 Tax=Actibacterium sp. MT2.3-13A TaxID=2828332 RepID=UPI001BA9E6F1|nr:CbiX/SirB N-terminal domain-containing protein [Actibacterium sp. MT2.3-13A]